MKIVHAFPPNIEAIREKCTPNEHTVFTYGNTLYNPGRWKIGRELMVHEEVHVKQQGNDPEGWWKKYLADPQFRLSQEIPAYRAQWKATLRGNEKDKLGMLRIFARDLSSEIYGNVISFEEAMTKIRQ